MSVYKVDFQNILDKVKYLEPNLSINSLFLTIFSKIQIFTNNRFTTLVGLEN